MHSFNLKRFRVGITVVFVCLAPFLINTFTKVAQASTYIQGACSPIPESKKCIDATPCKLDTSGVLVCLAGVSLLNEGKPSSSNPLGSLSVTKACWQYSFDFACSSVLGSIEPTGSLGGSSLVQSSAGLIQSPNLLATPVHNGCAYEQSNNFCSLVNSFCSSQFLSETGQTQCAQYQQTYSCLDQTTTSNLVATDSQPAVCRTPLLQSSALSLGVGSLGYSPLVAPVPSPNSFAQTAIAMEIANEIQTYSGCAMSGQQGCVAKSLFGGVRESCTKGWLGLKNCCTSQPGAKSNSAMLGLVLGPMASTVKYAGEKAVDLSSPYVFDAMYSNGAYTQGMTSAITQSANVLTDSEGFAQTTIFASGGVNLSAFGINIGMGAAPLGGGLFGATTEFSALSSASQGYYVNFNPYVFAANMAVTVIEEMGQCSADEVVLAMHRGQDLSVYVSEACIEEVPITNTCIAYRDNYCSFNGVLGKIINQQGKAQLGDDFSSCSGLSTEQIASIDFTKINFSEFTGLLMQQATTNLPQNIGANYLPLESSRKQGSQQKVGNGTGYPLLPPSSPQTTPSSH